MSPFDLDHRVAPVMGCSKGMGLALAQGRAPHGGWMIIILTCRALTWPMRGADRVITAIEADIGPIKFSCRQRRKLVASLITWLHMRRVL